MPDPATVLAAIDFGLTVANKAADLSLKIKDLFSDNSHDFDAYMAEIRAEFDRVGMNLDALNALSRNILTVVDDIDRTLQLAQQNQFNLDVYRYGRLAEAALADYRDAPTETLAEQIIENSRTALLGANAFAPADYAIGALTEMLAVRVRVIDDLQDGAFAVASDKAAITAAVQKIDAFVAQARATLDANKAQPTYDGRVLSETVTGNEHTGYLTITTVAREEWSLVNNTGTYSASGYRVVKTVEKLAAWETISYTESVLENGWGSPAAAVNAGATADAARMGLDDLAALADFYETLTYGQEMLAATYGDTFAGGAWGDVLKGSDNANTLSGEGGNDVVYGYGGDDNLLGGGGDDVLRGGDGNDTVHASLGNDVVDGGAGFDTLSFATFASGVSADLASAAIQSLDGSNANLLTITGFGSVVGSAFADSLTGATLTAHGGGGNDTLGIDGATGFGGDGDDVIRGGTGADTGVGGAGNDLFDGAGGSDTVSYSAAGAVAVSLASGRATGEGTDTLVGVENVVGSASGDRLRGDGTGNRLEGGGGDDTLAGGGGDDALDGGAGTDTAAFDNATQGVRVGLATAAAQNTRGDGVDTLRDIENLSGSNFDDRLDGSAGGNMLLGLDGDDRMAGGDGNDSLGGDRGDDTLLGGRGDDTLAAGIGTDTASYADLDARVVVTLATTAAQNTRGGGIDTLRNVENLVGSTVGDRLEGSDVANLLSGDGGDDALFGAGGSDTLVGGVGIDTLTGGAGADTFRFAELGGRSARDTADTIADFSRGDVVDLSSFDANVFAEGLQHFRTALLGAGDAFTRPGQIRIVEGGRVTVIELNVDGDATADAAIALSGAPRITGEDLLLA